MSDPIFGGKVRVLTNASSRDMVRSVCAEVMATNIDDDNEDLFNYGLDSLAIMEIRERLESQMSGELNVAVFFDEAPSIARLAASVDQSS